MFFTFTMSTINQHWLLPQFMSLILFLPVFFWSRVAVLTAATLTCSGCKTCIFTQTTPGELVTACTTTRQVSLSANYSVEHVWSSTLITMRSRMMIPLLISVFCIIVYYTILLLGSRLELYVFLHQFKKKRRKKGNFTALTTVVCFPLLNH